MAIPFAWSVPNSTCSVVKSMESFSTIFGRLTSTPVSLILYPCRPGLEPNFLVRTKAVWDLIEPTASSPRPSHRTGHVMVSYGEKLVVCVIYSYTLVQLDTQVE